MTNQCEHGQPANTCLTCSLALSALHNAYPALAAELLELRLHKESANAQCRELADALDYEADKYQTVLEASTDLAALYDQMQAENEALRARVSELEGVKTAAEDYLHARHTVDDMAAGCRLLDALAALTPEKPHDR